MMTKEVKFNRRDFIKTTVGGGLLAAMAGCQPTEERSKVSVSQLDKAAAQPVLKTDYFSSPVTIESIELLYNGRYYMVRSRAKDGAVGIAVTNTRAGYLYPILNRLVIPFFIDKDARDLDSLLFDVYRNNSNYKPSGLALWCCVAWVEFSLLDLLGKIAGKPVGELIGKVIRREIPVYFASSRRDTTPEDEVELLQKRIEETGVKAVKFRVGGRMSNNADAMPGRTENLIPLARKVLGDDIAIHADSNSSYDPPKAIEVGRMLEDINAVFFEEPCPFDHLEDTKKAADVLTIPIAWGEQETSLRRFRWMIQNNGVQVVQPDLHYNGGLIRATRVARMAAVAGLPTNLHISGGLGYVDMLHFASCTPDIGQFQEYKGDVPRTGKLYDPPLRLKNGAINVPTGPGLGLTHVDELLRNAKKIV